MKTIINPNREQWGDLTKRATFTYESVEDTVNSVFKDVRLNGNSAISKYTVKFDKVKLVDFLVSKQELQSASENLSPELKAAIKLAKSNIEAFHKAQETSKVELETTPGVSCWQEKRAIQKVGLYIPGGTAPLFSSVLMLAIPAKVAGCEDIVLCSPPNKEGKISDAILYAADLCGVTKIMKVGGIQAIAAMTFGTETIPKVSKIFGPGNQYVTVAKQMATKFGVSIDMPAGPSELLVAADDSAIPSYVASDLLSQAEHGSDSQVILVSTSKNIIEKVSNELETQLEQLPRKEMASKAIENSKSIYFDDEKAVLEFINEYAPEHFIVCCKNEDFFVEGVMNAGSVFIGNYTPESAGDYASGTNHTLPTNGYCKAYSGVNLDSFKKSITFQKLSKKGIKSIGPSIELMAETEGLQAHKNAVTLRLNDLKDE